MSEKQGRLEKTINVGSLGAYLDSEITWAQQNLDEVKFRFADGIRMWEKDDLNKPTRTVMYSRRRGVTDASDYLDKITQIKQEYRLGNSGPALDLLEETVRIQADMVRQIFETGDFAYGTEQLKVLNKMRELLGHQLL